VMRSLLALTLGLSTLSPAMAAPAQWGDNGHWYEFVATPVTWQEAFDAANAASYLGMQGYLATVTSAAENSFVSSSVAGRSLAWLGGSDSGAGINEWTWRNGPEAGQAFTYTNWNSIEPNNCCGGEDFVHTNWSGTGLWNDHGGPGNPGQANGYVIEYSMAPVPEPQTYALLLAGLGLIGLATRRRPN